MTSTATRSNRCWTASSLPPPRVLLGTEACPTAIRLFARARCSPKLVHTPLPVCMGTRAAWCLCFPAIDLVHTDHPQVPPRPTELRPTHRASMDITISSITDPRRQRSYARMTQVALATGETPWVSQWAQHCSLQK
jgi:hypothetical protein